MKTLIKLLIAAAVINACARVGYVAWQYFQLKDEAHALALFSTDVNGADLQAAVADAAATLNVALDPADVEVARDGQRTRIAARYSQPVELFPGYTYPLDLSFDVDAIATRPVTANDALGRR